MNLIENPREPARADAVQPEGKCQPGEHNYSWLFPDSSIMVVEDGRRIVLLFCSRCGRERVIDLTAFGVPRSTLPNAR